MTHFKLPLHFLRGLMCTLKGVYLFIHIELLIELKSFGAFKLLRNVTEVTMKCNTYVAGISKRKWCFDQWGDNGVLELMGKHPNTWSV